MGWLVKSAEDLGINKLQIAFSFPTISHFHHNFMTNGQQCNYHIFGKIIFHQIVLKMC